MSTLLVANLGHGWMGHVLLENNNNVDDIAQWFLHKEIKIKGIGINKNIKPGGWAFQFNNEYYPDVDDTALIGMFLHRYNKTKKYKNRKLSERTREWIISMQSQNGGWGAFDIDNNKYYLNSIHLLITVHYLTLQHQMLQQDV